MEHRRIAIAGAGAIGCYVGGALAAAGQKVTLLGRARILGEIAENGLTVSDYTGAQAHVEAGQLTLTEDPADMAGADLVLVTVKARDTAEIGAQIAQHCAESAAVVSLQNGVTNPQVLRDQMPGRDIRPGMVPFNVVPAGPGHFHRSTSGDLAIGRGPRSLTSVLTAPLVTTGETEDIVALQWGKLLVNLANAPNALSGLTVHQMLMNRDMRRILADQIAEALAALKHAGMPVIGTTPLPASLGPFVLRLPTPLFRRVAARMLTVDPTARTSMSYDLETGRPTEIESLQGAVIELCEQQGLDCPLNRHLRDLVRQAEAAGPGIPGLTPGEMRG